SISSWSASCEPKTCKACRISHLSRARSCAAGQSPRSRPAQSLRVTARSSRKPTGVTCRANPHPPSTSNGSEARRRDGVRNGQLSCEPSKPQQATRVAAEYLGFVFSRDRRGFEPIRAHRVGGERPVDREHDAIDAHLHHAANKRIGGKISASREVEVRAESVTERTAAAIARTRQRFVDAAEQE